ncbi:MAG: TonB family protein [Parvularculaceae bacterium]|nr:TonB family protein [Parvularculaceae bacterium]
MMSSPQLSHTLLLLLGAATACASKPEVPIVFDPRAEPFIRVDVENFESCLNDVDEFYDALVEVELETTFDGYVENARISRSTDPCFDEPVLNAVKKWRYPPKQVDGVLARRRGVKAVLAFSFDRDQD